MKKKYEIQGMTCNGCVATVKKGLESLADVNMVDVSLNPPQAIITSNHELDIANLQSAIGKYKISEIKDIPALKEETEIAEVSFVTYKPLILIISFVAGVSLLSQYPFNDFSYMLWMRYFMAGFFLVFAFFKLLNIQGFADSYRMYDIVAKKWLGWGYIYPFVELVLGLLYLTNILPMATNVMTVLVLGISSIGVIKSNLNNQKIKCACLGDVFNLPMSTVTVIEDVTMVTMAAIMLLIPH